MKKQSEVTPLPATPTSSRLETVCPRALDVTISQMTLGAAPPLAASAMPCPTAIPTLPAVAPPLRATAMPAGVTDTTTTAAHTTAQLATGHPYVVHPPPPGFPYPSWVFTLLADVSLSLPPVYKTSPTSPSQRCATDGRSTFTFCPGVSTHPDDSRLCSVSGSSSDGGFIDARSGPSVTSPDGGLACCAPGRPG